MVERIPTSRDRTRRDIFVRNDLIAKRLGTCERTINRQDAEGAPYLMIGNVKYRPRKAYDAFFAARLQRKNQRRGRAAR
jgi:hypothetical protein